MVQVRAAPGSTLVRIRSLELLSTTLICRHRVAGEMVDSSRVTLDGLFATGSQYLRERQPGLSLSGCSAANSDLW